MNKYNFHFLMARLLVAYARSASHRGSASPDDPDRTNAGLPPGELLDAWSADSKRPLLGEAGWAGVLPNLPICTPPMFGIILLPGVAPRRSAHWLARHAGVGPRLCSMPGGVPSVS